MTTCPFYLLDGPVATSIPTAPSKPLYLHDVRCSEGNLALLECGFTKSDVVTINKHAVVKCQECKWHVFDCDHHNIMKCVLIAQLNVKMET